MLNRQTNDYVMKMSRPSHKSPEAIWTKAGLLCLIIQCHPNSLCPAAAVTEETCAGTNQREETCSDERAAEKERINRFYFNITYSSSTYSDTHMQPLAR
ncbi:hypothetical protein DdX_14977 [Ditylenchus destructor]|uniref:Uncharacterized protein n=1 Tax=Ditylenchus destructor TaxID=166010 RepID=A0AAD4MT37_9BILA|nr:hypothetical protein DdX_14977 [Ditylenchus destructor]